MTDRNHGWSARLTRLFTGVVGGEPNPISRRPLNQADDEDLANAWTELHRVTPTGWHVEQPTYNPGRRQWEQHAVDTARSPRTRSAIAGGREWPD